MQDWLYNLPENWKSVSSCTIGSTNSILFLRWWSRLTFLPDFLVGLSNFWKKAFLPLLASFARMFAFTFGLRPSMPNLGKDPWSRSTSSSSSPTSSLELSISSFSSWFLIRFLPLRNPPLFWIARGGLTVVVKPSEEIISGIVGRNKKQPADHDGCIFFQEILNFPNS